LRYLYNLLKRVKVFTLSYINFFIFFRLNNIKKDSTIHIYDIDNTLTDTWKFLNSSNKYILRELDFSNGMKKLINDLYSSNQVLFFTVRPLSKWNDTRIWLSLNLSKFKWFHLFLFSTPSHKIDFVLKLNDLGYKIILTDDLSYNHENGDVKFYIDEILRIKKSEVSYVSYGEILEINKKY
jgi:hypothetical protein